MIEHIRRINAFKKQYRSEYPALRWQDVAFGHNEHEIGRARAMARELGMEFYVKSVLGRPLWLKNSRR